MKSTIGNFNLHWLITPGASVATPVDETLTIHRMDYQIPTELGKAWLDSFDLNNGMRLYRATHHLEKVPFGEMLPILEIVGNEPEPTFCAQTWLSGIGCHHEYWRGRNFPSVEVWGRPGQDTFRLTQQWDACVLIAGGGTTKMCSVTVSQPLLRTLLGDSFEAQLLEKLGLDKVTQAVVRQVPQHLNIPLQKAMSDQYTGSTKRLFAQAKVLEYLGLVIDFIKIEKNTTHQRRHTQKIRKLRDYLLSIEGSLPTLNSLATDFGLSAKQLNIEFKIEFGKSIFEYVLVNRLEQAHDALLESNIPMKLISDRLGYSHVNHFITAFKRQFSYPPGSLRKVSSN